MTGKQGKTNLFIKIESLRRISIKIDFRRARVQVNHKNNKIHPNLKAKENPIKNSNSNKTNKNSERMQRYKFKQLQVKWEHSLKMP
jgi:hypothetical protein